jgi:UDP-N-acetyl-D-mannosaminuronate dehydrogenase
MVLIENTMPPGTNKYLAYPLRKKAFRARGLEYEPFLSHNFERVMPKRDYVTNTRDFWLICSGVKNPNVAKWW